MRSRSETVYLATTLVMLIAASCAAHVDERARPAITVTSVTVPPVLSPDPTIAPAPTIVDPGLAYGVPCKPPCWYRLTPGTSTRQEASQAVEQLLASGQAVHISAMHEHAGWSY
jgi:hypothetical protein